MTMEFASARISKTKVKVKILKYKKDNFVDELRTENFGNSASDDVEELANLFQTEVNRVTNKLCVRKNVRHSENVWYNIDLGRAKYVKIKKREKALLTDAQSDWSNYRVSRNEYKRKVEKAKNSYIMNKLGNCVDQKSMWKTLKTLVLNETRKEIRDVFFDGALVKDDLTLAAKFNEFFIKSVEEINDSIPDVQYKDNLTAVSTNFKFTCVSLDDLEHVLKAMNNKRDFNLVNKQMILDSFSKTGRPLLNVINASLKSGRFPDLWKESMVTPIEKVKNAKNCVDFRPINSMPLGEKILEKIIYLQLEAYFEVNGLMVENQSGFRRNHSCESAINMVLNLWKEHLANKQKVIGVFLDLKRAFETVDRHILLLKLEKYGIRDNELKWFKEYLTNRRQKTKVNARESTSLLVNLGVPQGSVLGTLLFIIYINDLQKVLKHVKLALFADDALLFVASDNVEEGKRAMQEDLERVSLWLKENKLKLNVAKTKCMCLNDETELNLTIDSSTIEQVNQIKYLGVIIDNKLRFGEHILYMSKKIAKKIGFLNRIRRRLSLMCAINIYNVMVKPHFEYCSTVLAFCNQEQLMQLYRNFKIRQCDVF